MIETGLPYDFDNINEISENGALVDMTKINYPTFEDEDSTRITFIYLRNTDYKNIDLDFSKCDYEIKEKFLRFYLLGDIEYNIKELSSSFVKILARIKNIDLDIPTILNEDEEVRFIESNKELIEELNTFTYSLPLFSFCRLNIDGLSFNYDDIEKTDFKFNSNICSLIENDAWNLFYGVEYTGIYKFYSKMFVEDNNRLFETIMKYTPFSVLLYGMTDEEKFIDFVNMVYNCEE